MTTSIDKLTPQAFFLHVDMYAVSPKFKTNFQTKICLLLYSQLFKQSLQLLQTSQLRAH